MVPKQPNPFNNEVADAVEQLQVPKEAKTIINTPKKKVPMSAAERMKNKRDRDKEAKKKAGTYRPPGRPRKTPDPKRRQRQ